MPFSPFKKTSDWEAAELQECFRVTDSLARAGIAATLYSGESDEGEPWCVALDAHTGHVICHLARIDGHYVIGDASGHRLIQDQNLNTAIGTFLRSAHFTQLTKKKRGQAFKASYLLPLPLLAFMEDAQSHGLPGENLLFHNFRAPDNFDPFICTSDDFWGNGNNAVSAGRSVFAQGHAYTESVQTGSTATPIFWHEGAVLPDAFIGVRDFSSLASTHYAPPQDALPLQFLGTADDGLCRLCPDFI